MKVKAKPIFIGALLIALALVPIFSRLVDQPFYLDIFTRILIFSIAALSLDLILGYGGMVSFGHAVYLGIGAYAVGILSQHGITNGFIHFGVAISACALAALLIGLVCLRTAGIHFIMITLAFAQMAYFLAISVDTYGGDNGLNITQHSSFPGLIDLDNPIELYYFSFGLLVALLYVFHLVVNSRFGMVIRGAKSNERRMIALGFPVLRYKLTAFVIAGAVCGLAGALLANQILFISPSTMHWTRSGEIMIMVILGGMGSLVGPIAGTTIYLLLEHVLANATEHWQAIMGPLLILVVMFAKRGVFGIFHKPDSKRDSGSQRIKPTAPVNGKEAEALNHA